MLSLNLPKLDPAITPDFVDARTCKHWLELLPVINVRQAHTELIDTLDKFSQANIDPLERLKALELVREPASFLQGEMTKKFRGKPLPLAEMELDAWQRVQKLWNKLSTGYQQCLQACIDGKAEILPHAALTCHRVMYYLGRSFMDYYHAGWQIDEARWSLLHDLFEYAEQGRFADTSVKDRLAIYPETQTCRSAFTKILLIYQANPYTITLRQLQLVERLASRWCHTVDMAEVPLEPNHFGLIVNRSKSLFPLPLPESATHGNRYLCMDHIGRSLRKRVKLLRAGESPQQLDLGDDCSQPGCEHFLLYLHKHWCEGVAERTFQRRAAKGDVPVCFGINVMHYQISGILFNPPTQGGRSLSAKEAAEMAVFGYVSQKSKQEQVQNLGFDTENWQVLDESATGFRLLRPILGGGRVSHQQLMAIRPIGSQKFILGSARWIMLTAENEMQVGVRTFPGIPQSVSVRSTGVAAAGFNKYVQALLLPEVPTLKSPPTLILPVGWFKPKRLIDLWHEDDQYQVKLYELLDKGPDFERVTFDRT